MVNTGEGEVKKRKKGKKTMCKKEVKSGTKPTERRSSE